jgi:hypothetical protein
MQWRSKSFAALQAIQCAVEKLDFDLLPDFDALAVSLDNAADARPRHAAGGVEGDDVVRERDLFRKVIQQAVKSGIPAQTRMPYRRVLSDIEITNLRLRLKEKWRVEPNGYWYPLSDAISPHTADFPLIAVSGPGACWATVDKVIDGELLKRKIRAFLKDRSLDRLYELREDDESFFLEKTLATFDYNGFEGYWFSATDDWLAYASHEGTLTLAGSIAGVVGGMPD